VSDEPHEPPLFADDEDAVFDAEPAVDADPFVAHATPDVGTTRNRRLFFFGVVPIVAVALALGLYFALR
jgi:hypothetical protein